MTTIHQSTARRRRVVALAIATGLLLAPTLAACSNPLESIVENVTGGNVEIGGTSVPADFPSEVPLIDGDVLAAFAVGSETNKVWTVTKKVGDASALDSIKADLEGAGFTSELDQEVGGISGAAYTNGNYGVLVVVTEDGNGGWAATYTVTPAGS